MEDIVEWDHINLKKIPELAVWLQPPSSQRTVNVQRNAVEPKHGRGVLILVSDISQPKALATQLSLCHLIIMSRTKCLFQYI